MMSDFPSIGDRRYQEKVVAALLQDLDFAEQMADVIQPEFFDQLHLKEIAEKYFDHKTKYNTWPSADVVDMMLKEDEDLDEVITFKANQFLEESAMNPLNGDMSYIQDKALDFCKRQLMSDAISVALDHVETGTYDSIVKVIMDAMAKGESRDMGHEYMLGFTERAQADVRDPIPTPWKVVNKILNGGWERKGLHTFIAPTGVGKTHFLCNTSAGGIAAGYNVAYITLEIAEYKVGLRHDAYFSGIAINDVSGDMERVEQEVKNRAHGRLFIKEFPTKRASVQTIRSYLQRLRSLHNFVPDLIVVDYADLLRATRTYGEKRHELEGNYEDLRALGYEFNAAIITADQTNRTGLTQELVTLDSIAECYAKATVCDLIMTLSRQVNDKLNNAGRMYIAKSRLGKDGIVLPFLMDGATVRATVFEQAESVSSLLEEKPLSEQIRDRLETKKNKS